MRLVDVYNDVLKEIDGIRGASASFDSSSSFSGQDNSKDSKELNRRKKLRRQPKMQSVKPLHSTDIFERK